MRFSREPTEQEVALFWRKHQKRLLLSPSPQYRLDKKFVRTLLSRCIAVHDKELKRSTARELVRVQKNVGYTLDNPETHLLFAGASTYNKSKATSYGQIRIPTRLLSDAQKQKRGIALTHRLFYDLFVAPLLPLTVVDHVCSHSHGLCCRPEHLHQISIAENCRNAFRDSNRDVAGSQNPNSVLTEEEVRSIRKSVLTDSLIALLYNVSRSHISALRQLPADENPHWRVAWPTPQTMARTRKRTRFSTYVRHHSRRKLCEQEDYLAATLLMAIAKASGTSAKRLNKSKDATHALTAQFGRGTKAPPRFAAEVLRRFVKRSVNSHVGVNEHDGQRQKWTADQLALAFQGLAKLREISQTWTADDLALAGEGYLSPIDKSDKPALFCRQADE